jgi:hypothetical protein
MISISIGVILQGWDNDPFDARIYLIRDDDLVFFVGVLEGAILKHLLRHCGLVDNGLPSDRVGRLILDNAPNSNGWVVDLLSLEDCEPIVREVMPLVKRVDAGRASFCLVTYYRPCLVEKDNPEPVLLPERYKRGG